VAGARIKTVRSHLTVNDLARLLADGATIAGASPLPQVEGSDAIEVERIVARGGTVSRAGRCWWLRIFSRGAEEGSASSPPR
jgi:hypothetical protein